jgi:TonB family protein
MLGPLLIAVLLAQGQVVGPPTPLNLPPPTPTPQQAKAEVPWPPPGVSRPGNGVMPPKLVKEAKPTYRADAMRAKISGRIVLEAVVKIDGTIEDVRVIRSLDDNKYGMDDEAISTVKKWAFQAGTKDGAAVPVLIEIEMSFTIKQ